MLSLSRLQLSATLAAAVAGRAPHSLVAAAVAPGPPQVQALTLLAIAGFSGMAVAAAANTYTENVGACRGGTSPDNSAGLVWFDDRNCQARCDTDAGCTGFLLPVSGNWCETYDSVGAYGDGRSEYRCFMKGGSNTDAPTTNAPSDSASDVPTESPAGCVPYLVDSGNCAKPLTFEECENAANALGHNWIETPINPDIMDKPFDHIPGGCYAKKKNRNDEIIKMRYNPHNDPGTNCGQDTKEGKFTKVCVCCV